MQVVSYKEKCFVYTRFNFNVIAFSKSFFFFFFIVQKVKKAMIPENSVFGIMFNSVRSTLIICFSPSQWFYLISIKKKTPGRDYISTTQEKGYTTGRPAPNNARSESKEEKKNAAQHKTTIQWIQLKVDEQKKKKKRKKRKKERNESAARDQKISILI